MQQRRNDRMLAAPWPRQRTSAQQRAAGFGRVSVWPIYSERLFEWHERYAELTATYEATEADAFLAAYAIAMLVVGGVLASHGRRTVQPSQRAELVPGRATDRLTGLHSRPWGEVLLAQLDPSQLRFCAIIDARRFNEINSCFGYAMGDQVLVEIA